MDSQRYWLGLASAQLVREMPLTVVTTLANAISQYPESDHSALIRRLPSAEFREMASRFLDVWRLKAPDLSPDAIAAALTTATHVQRYHNENAVVELVWTGPESHRISVPANRAGHPGGLELRDETAHGRELRRLPDSSHPRSADCRRQPRRSSFD